LGDAGVGKTALTIQFTRNAFVTEYDPTVEDIHRTTVPIDDSRIPICILDTAGQEEFGTLKNTYINLGQGFICVYAVNNRSSFDQVKALVKKIHWVKDRNDLPVIIVANKCDLESTRQISSEEGLLVSESLRCHFIETSAKTGQNVERLFVEISQAVLQYLQANTLEPALPYRNRKKHCHLL